MGILSNKIEKEGLKRSGALTVVGNGERGRRDGYTEQQNRERGVKKKLCIDSGWNWRKGTKRWRKKLIGCS